jgi:hypothetical protein
MTESIGQAGVQVTDEMVRVGVSVLRNYDPDYDLGPEVVTEIFAQMLSASRQFCGTDQKTP